MKYFLINAVIVLLLSGCSTNPSSTRGSLFSGLSGSSPGAMTLKSCGEKWTLDNQQQPGSLYSKMAQCVNAKKYDDGAMLFALAGSYSYFDALRLGAGNSGHKELLTQALSHVDEDKRQSFWARLQALLGEPAKLAAICHQVRALGMPSYSPSYLANYLATQSSQTTASKSKEGGNLPALWEKSLTSYLHCPAVTAEAVADAVTPDEQP